MKKLRCIQRSVDRHWVGDGFPVRTLLRLPEPRGRVLSPFLLLDYAGPTEFPPTTERRGVGQHPHRGFETVTIVYAGEVEHRDSSGGGGRIGPGDVQWMTAASGIVHEEFHGREFAQRGGPVRDGPALGQPAAQATRWRLPATRRSSRQPRSRSVPLPGGLGTARVIAGEFAGAKGPAQTFTPMHVVDLRSRRRSGRARAAGRLDDGARRAARRAARWTARSRSRAAEVGAVRPRGREHRASTGDEAATALLLAGEPIDEPIVGQGPVRDEQPWGDPPGDGRLQSGRMGRL